MNATCDVVIIGAGIGGVITGAILAKQEKMKVLVLERESAIGGRTISFGGPHGNYSEEEYRKLLRGAADCYIVESEPSVGELINKGLFQDHILDCGWHGTSGGVRCRYALLARMLGKKLAIEPSVGGGFWRDGRWVQLPELFLGWPKESLEENIRLRRWEFNLSAEETAEYDHVNMEEYYDFVTQDQMVRDFNIQLSRYQVGTNDPKRISAGEIIRLKNFSQAAGVDFIRGGSLGEPVGGFKNIVNVFADIITENGGEVRTNARVKEVIIKGNEAQGVVVEQNGKESKIEASAVVSNVTMNHEVFDIIPESRFPEELRQRIKNAFPVAGLVGHLKLKELLEPEQPRSQFIIDKLPGVELWGGLPSFAFEQTSGIDASRVLKGDGYIIQTWIALCAKDPDEAHDKDVLKRLTEAQLSFLRKQYPRFDDILDWYIIIATDNLQTLAVTPGLIGDRRPPAKHPLIKNLYFTGDGMTQWDVGTNGAAHGAIICANAVTGKDYLSLLPPYMR